MKYILLLTTLMFTRQALSQMNYNVEYARVMATVAKWESKPDSIIRVDYKRSFKGRNVRLQMQYVEKIQEKSGKRYSTYRRKYRLKHTHKGIVETTRAYVNGAKVGYIKKVDGKYILVEVYSDVIILDKIVITNINSQKNTYFKQQ